MNDETQHSYAARAFETQGPWWNWILVGLLGIPGGILAGAAILLLGQAFFGSGILVQGSISFTAFSFLAIATYLPVILLLVFAFLGQKPGQFLSGHPRFRWHRLFQAAGFWLLASLILEFLAFALKPASYQLNNRTEHLLALMGITFFLVPLQATAEEVFFRGYLQQALVRFTRRPWLAILVTASLFFLLHGANPEFEKFGLAFSILNYGGFGIMFGMLAYLDEGLEAAIGIHAINNMYGTLIVGFDDSVSGGFALFSISPYDPVLGTLQFYLAALAVFFLLLRRQRSGLLPRLGKVALPEQIPNP